MSYLFYDNIYRTSPSQRLRLEICSPHNNPGHPPGVVFQSNFAFTVRDHETGEFLWQHCPGKQSQLDEPVDACLSDEGYVVVLTKSFSGSNIFVLDPDGDVCFSVEVSEKLLGGNSDELRKTFRSTCRWNEGGTGVFFSNMFRLYWGFRTVFDRNIVIDLQQHRLVDAETLTDSLRSTQHTWALSVLRRVANDERFFVQSPDPCRVSSAFADDRRLSWIAARWCGLDVVEASIPSLLSLESSTVWSSIKMGWPTSDTKSTSFVELGLTQAVQMALRRMGHRSLGIAPYQLWRYDACEDQLPRMLTRISIPDRLTDRPKRLLAVREGMSCHEVVELVGMPDVDCEFWDYDLPEDDGQSYTFRLTFDGRFDSPARLKDIVRLPPAWTMQSRRSISF